jgi:hypothetical protein
VGHKKSFAIIKILVTGGGCLQAMKKNLEGNGENLKCAGLESIVQCDTVQALCERERAGVTGNIFHNL